MARLSKAQKSAIVNKIVAEMRKRDCEIVEKAIENFVPTEEEAKILADVDEMNELYGQILKIASKYEVVGFKGNEYYSPYTKEPKSHKEVVSKWVKDKLNIHFIYETESILNDLELQTIDSSFDIDEFINKYVK